MHDQSVMRSSGGGCPVMHGDANSEASKPVFNACHREIQAYNKCQIHDVTLEKTRSHCMEEAKLLRECELARRRREKTTRMYEECVKNGGDSLSCLAASKND